MTEQIPAGTLLFKGIDSPPDKIDDPFGLNCEGVLWTAKDSIVAQTYIPEIGGRAYMRLPYAYQREDPCLVPDDGLIEGIFNKLGGRFEILRREHPFNAQTMKDYPARLISNDTVGRPMSWRQAQSGPEITWKDIFAELRRLGYDPKYDTSISLKTGFVDGIHTVLHAHARLKGTLIVFKAIQLLDGYDKTDGSNGLLDPDYHRGGAWSKAAMGQGKDFVALDDFCQTQLHGNVGHTSYAINRLGRQKLAIEAILPAFHREWDTEFITAPTIEERAWKRGLIRSQHQRLKEAA